MILKLIKARRDGKLSFSFFSFSSPSFFSSSASSFFSAFSSSSPCPPLLLPPGPLPFSFWLFLLPLLPRLEHCGSMQGAVWSFSKGTQAHWGWGSCLYFHFGHHLLDDPGHVSQHLYDSILVLGSADVPVLLWEPRAEKVPAVSIWQAQRCTYK